MTQRHFSVIGVGGGGGRIVNLQALPVENIITAAIDTDTTALEETRAATRLPIGGTRTGGIGTGGDANLGRLAAEDDLDRIRELFPQPCFAVVVVALGGGTGNGATPVVLREARNQGALTLCLATLPFEFEGSQRQAAAREALEAIRNACDSVITIPNDRLFEAVDIDTVGEAFRRADEILAVGVGSLVRLLARPGEIRLDYADIKRMIQDNPAGCTLGFGEGSGPDRVAVALKPILEGPLLERGAVLRKARSLAVCVLGGPDLQVREIGAVMDALADAVPVDCRIAMGTALSDTWQDRLTITVLASDALPGLQPAKPKEKALSGARRRSGRKGRSSRKQAMLGFNTGTGRFNRSEPTILDGMDLDVPTFIRRGIQIER